MLSKIVSNNTASVFLNNALLTFNKSNIGESLFNRLTTFLNQKNLTEDQVQSFLVGVGLVNTSIKEDKALVESYTEGKISISSSGTATYKTEAGYEIPLPKVLVEKVKSLYSQDLDYSYIVNFMEKLMANPRAEVREELYLFLESGNIPITPDGDFLAYKKVDLNLRSFHVSPDGTYLQHVVGQSVSMPREEVDADRNRTCSKGLHFCSFSYLPNYQSNDCKVLILKINPADVVSIPSDYSNSKGRAWNYTVLSIHNDGQGTEKFTKDTVVFGDNLKTLSSDKKAVVSAAVSTASHTPKSKKAQEMEDLVVGQVNKIRGDGYSFENEYEEIVRKTQSSSLGKKNKLTRDYIRQVISENF